MSPFKPVAPTGFGDAGRSLAFIARHASARSQDLGQMLDAINPYPVGDRS